MARSIQEYVDELYGKGQGTLNQIHEQRKQSDQQLIDSVNAAIDRTTAASTKPYQTQIEQLPEAYQKQFDANAVQELVGRRKVEEAMANMGLTDSGLNRTQQTALSVQRGNADAAARLEQQKKTQELQDKIAQLIEAGAAQKQQQEASVRSNTSNWFNDALAGSYNTAMQQGTSMYNADLARDEQARQAELDRQNALAVADKQKEAAQEKAKQQEFERQKAIVESLTAAGYSKDEIDAYIRSVGWISGGAIKGTENTQRYINQMNQTAQGIKRMSGSSTEYTEKLTTAIKNDLAILYDSGKLSEAEVAYLIKYYGL
jgi:hypothetical protein